MQKYGTDIFYYYCCNHKFYPVHGRFSMYRSLEYIIIMSRNVGLTSKCCTVTCQEGNTKVFGHFNTEEKKKKTEIIPFPGPSPNPNPNCKHQALTIWLRVTADNCGALHCL